VNPGLVKKFADARGARNKTDEADAETIREFCRRMEPEAWVPPSKAVLALRDAILLRDSLVAARVEWKNRLSAGLAPDTASQAKEIVAFLERRVRKAEASVARAMAADAGLARKGELLSSIPGVGSVTAAVVASELPDGLKDPKAVAAYAGLSPRRAQSGRHEAGTRLSKAGNKRLRHGVYMAALSAMKHNAAVKEFAARMERNGLKGKRLVCACARKLLVLCWGVLRSGVAWDAKLHAACTENPAAA